MMRRGSRAAFMLSFLILAAGVLLMTIMGVSDLSKNSPQAPDNAEKGELCEFTADFAAEMFSVNNMLEFIPIGKEHYYLMYASDEKNVPFLVRAKPSWIEKHFDEYGSAKDGGVKITGIVNELSREVKSDVSKLNIKLIQMDAKVSSSMYIDARYREFGILKIVSGIGLAAASVLLFIAHLGGVLRTNKFLRLLLMLLLMAFMVLTAYTLSFG